MQRMQRQFGKYGKRSADETDVGVVLAEFQTADKLLDSFLDSARAFQNAWKDILAKQFAISNELDLMYKPIEGDDAEVQHGTTPEDYLKKAVSYKAAQVELQQDLQHETDCIQTKLIHPAMEAKEFMGRTKKTIKHRENAKLDFERYRGRVDSLRPKVKSPRDEAALAKHETDLTQATYTYKQMDDHVKRTLPPLIDAVTSLVPLLLANLVELQHGLVGQLYTVMHGYCQSHGMPTGNVSLEQIVAVWDREFTPLREECEQGLNTLRSGKAIYQPMSLPDKQKTVTGLGIRGKVGMGGRKPSQTSLTPIGNGSRPALTSQPSQNSLGTVGGAYEEDDELAPPKPPRYSPSPGPGPIPLASKPRIPSSTSIQTRASGFDDGAPPPKPARPVASPGPAAVPFSSKSRTGSMTPGTPGYGYVVPTPLVNTPGAGSPSGTALRRESSSSTPFLTPMGSSHNLASSQPPTDYFGQRKMSSSSVASSVVGKKKPPPPPTKPKPSPSLPAQYVTAMYDFAGQGAGDLAFKEGDRIKIKKKSDSTDDWWLGELGGVEGSFPANYVQI